MKTNGAKHSKLKELFFPGREEPGEAVPNRVARFTSVFWVAHMFCIQSNKYWKAVNFAVNHGKKMPALFFWSQAEKDAQKLAKDTKLKAVHAKYLEDINDAREAKQDVKQAAAKRKRIGRAKV